jgi:hypothetical protein
MIIKWIQQQFENLFPPKVFDTLWISTNNLQLCWTTCFSQISPNSPHNPPLSISPKFQNPKLTFPPTMEYTCSTNNDSPFHKFQVPFKTQFHHNLTHHILHQQQTRNSYLNSPPLTFCLFVFLWFWVELVSIVVIFVSVILMPTMC